MRSEDLKGWLGEATQNKEPMRKWWIILVRLVQRMLRDGIPPAELACATMVLILKGKGKYWGIGLAGVAWKLCTEVLNCRLKQGVILHDALHRFRGGWGTGTATLEEKLTQQLAVLSHKPLFQEFLYIRKAYNSLEREIYIQVLSGYGVGTNLTCLPKS